MPDCEGTNEKKQIVTSLNEDDDTLSECTPLNVELRPGLSRYYFAELVLILSTESTVDILIPENKNAERQGSTIVALDFPTKIKINTFDDDVDRAFEQPRTAELEAYLNSEQHALPKSILKNLELRKRRLLASHEI